MPYYITKEIIENELLNIFKGLSLDTKSKLKLSIENFNFNVLEDDDIVLEIKNIAIDRTVVENFSDILFQLRDYRYYLKVVLTLFLKGNKYSEIAYLINRTFVNHIGDVIYVSGKNYDYSERYFDRFIEAVKFTEVNLDLVLDFIFYINQTSSLDICNKYVRPSKEFLKFYILENEKDYFSFIEESIDKYSIGIKLYVELYTEKGLNLILDKYVNFEIPFEEVVEDIVKEYKHNALPIIEKLLSTNNTDKCIKALNLLKMFKNDVQINNFIENYYKKTEDEVVKQDIKNNFLNQTDIEFNTVDDFKRFVANKQIGVIDTSLPDTYPLYFNNGTRVDDVSLSYIFDCFKKLDKPYKIKELEYLKNLLDLTSAEIVAKLLYQNFVYSKIINSSSIWVVAFIAMFGAPELNNEVISQVKSKMIDTLTSKVVFELYAEFNNPLVLRYVKENYANGDTSQLDILKIYARQNKISVDDYIDSMVSDYKLNEEGKRDIYFNGNYLVLTITENLNVELIDYASKSNYFISKDMVTSEENYYEYILALKKEIKDQIQRFKEAFYNFRLWDEEEFRANILSNNLLKKIASTLTWGYYKGTKLVSAFKIVDGEITYILNTPSSEEVYKIGLVHPVEIDQPKDIVASITFEPFNQIRRGVYKVSSNEYTLSKVSTFSGMLANYKYFIDFLKLQKWNNGLEVLGNLKSLVKKYPNENLLCEISFDKIDTDTISINDIRFYNLSSTLAQGNYFIIDKNESLLLNVISKRTYSNIMFEIAQACFN